MSPFISRGGWAEPVSMAHSHEAIHHVTHVCPIFSLHYVYQLLLLLMAFEIFLYSFSFEANSAVLSLKRNLKLRDLSGTGVNFFVV